LPRNQGESENFTSYWVSLSQFENSESFTIEANTNNCLTGWYIHSLLHQRKNEQQTIKWIIPISDKKAREFLEADLMKDYLNQYFENEEL